LSRSSSVAVARFPDDLADSGEDVGGR
jgi:hypothetical protein